MLTENTLLYNYDAHVFPHYGRKEIINKSLHQLAFTVNPRYKYVLQSNLIIEFIISFSKAERRHLNSEVSNSL